MSTIIISRAVRDVALAIVASVALATLGALLYFAGMRDGRQSAPAAVVATVTVTPSPARTVPCAQEDACALDYRDGAWHVGPDGSGHEVQPAEVPWLMDGAWYLWWGGRLLVWDALTLAWVDAPDQSAALPVVSRG